MKKYKKINLEEVIDIPNGIEIHEYNRKALEDLYNYYLTEKNCKIYYKNQDFLKYIDKNCIKIEPFDIDKHMKKMNRKINFEALKKGLLKSAIFLSLYACHVAGKDYVIHEKANITNSAVLLDNLSSDSNQDNITEIDTKILNNIDEYAKPNEDRYYNNTNPAYNLLDKTRVVDNVSMIAAMKYLNKNIVDIDNTIYSSTGKMSELTYLDENNYVKVYRTEKAYDDPKELISYVSTQFKRGEIHDIEYIGTYDVKTIEEIPTIYKYKEDGKIELKDSNKVLGKVAKKYLKHK